MLLCLFVLSMQAQEIAVIPQPAQMSVGDGKFLFNGKVVIAYPKAKGSGIDAVGFSQYEQIDVISFSYGVFMSQFVDIPKIHSNIAICGTLFPINREFGISPKIFDLTLKTLNDENLQKFYKNMFDEENEFEKFIQLNKTSQLNIENLKQELETIKSLAIENNKTKRKFTRVYVANNDKIIPARAQNAFWQDKINIKQLESGHFPFFKISLEDLLNE